MISGTPKRSRRKVGFLLAIVLTLVAAACGSPDDTVDDANVGSRADAGQNDLATDAGDPVYGGKLVYGLSAESNGWDPTLGQWAPWGLTVARTIFDTLTTFDEDGNVAPHLAESFTPNDDYTEWVVKLRPDVKFHNGEVLDAAALQANWEFFAASPLTGPIFEVRPASYEILSDLELKVTLPEPWAAFPAAFATQIGVVMAPETLGQDGSTRAREPIGTGPFMMEDWVLDSRLTVIRNPDYWQEGLPYLDEIEFRPIVDPTSRTQALKSGDIDVAFFDEPDQWAAFEGDDDFVTWQDPQAETPESFVMLNTLSPQLSDPRVRRALALATDRETFVEATTPGREPAVGPFKENSPWFAPTDYPDYDPEAARQLIAELEADGGPLEIELSVVPSVNQNQEAQLIAEMWGEVGIDVEIKATETAQLIIEIATGNYEAVMWRQFDSPSPLLEAVWWQEAFATDIGDIALNFARNRNPQLTDAIISAQETEDVAEQKGYFATVQQELATDIPYIWLSHIDPAVVTDTSVAGMFEYTVPGTDTKVMSFMNSANALTQIWISSG